MIASSWDVTFSDALKVKYSTKHSPIADWVIFCIYMFYKREQYLLVFDFSNVKATVMFWLIINYKIIVLFI